MEYDFEEFLNYKKFVEICPKKEQIAPLLYARSNLERMKTKALIALFRALTGKWPQQTDKDALVRCISRLIQKRYYVEIYGKEPSKNVLAKDKEALAQIGLGDTKPEPKKPKPVRCKMPEEAKPTEETPESTEAKEEKTKAKEEKKAKKPKKPKSEFSLKVAGMSLDEIVAWAKEVGVPQEKIDQHKDKKLGLAKMNLGNLIRPRVAKKD